jgi:hypothetical protein
VSAEHTGDEPLAWFDIHEAAPAKKWTLSLFRDYLKLEPRDGKAYEIDRADVPERVQKIESWLLRRGLIVTLGKKKVMFQLPSDAFAAVSAWIGPPTVEDLKVGLKRRLSWVVPIGILFVLSALPLGDLDWEPVSLALGLGLILTARLAKLWPHRNFFLIDSLWFASLAANSVWLLSQEWTWLRVGLLVLQLACVRSGWREYRRFAPEKIATEDDHLRDEQDQDQWER